MTGIFWTLPQPKPYPMEELSMLFSQKQFPIIRFLLPCYDTDKQLGVLEILKTFETEKEALDSFSQDSNRNIFETFKQEKIQ